MNNMDLRVKDVLTEDFWIMPATPKYTESGVPYITSKNIKNGIIDFTKINYISKESYDSISKNRPILVGDILISMIGTLGETAEVKESNGLFYGQNMFLVRIDEKKVDKRYFLNFFKSNYVKRMLEGKQNQSTQKYLKANHIEDLIIPVPSLDKQKLISSQLDKLSNIISLRSKELEYLDELVKARFVEMFDEYSKIELYKIADITMGQSPSSSSYNKDGNGLPFFQGKGDYGNKYTSVSNWTTEPNKIVEKGTVLMSVRAPVGPVNIANVKCCLGRGLCGINAVEGKTNNEFLYNALKVMEEDISSKGTGSTFKAITKKDVYELLVPNVPLELQNDYSLFSQQVDKSREIIQKKIDTYQELLDKLMQEYFG